MPADKQKEPAPAPPRYRFVTGVSLAALELELNRQAEHNAHMELKQVLHAPGAGFVAILEREDDADASLQREEKRRPRPSGPRRGT
jgi:hypothetical protein